MKMVRRDSGDDWVLPFSTVRTLVLVGRTGNGKSATGNSILGRAAFKSKASLSSVSTSCEMESVSNDESIVNVIDTPGLFDSSVSSDSIKEEVIKCVSLAKDGIHAVLVVLSVRSRFSREEAAAIESLRKFFGSKISDYMIVVFTGGDELEENDETLDDYLANCPEPLKKTLCMCDGRRVLFDNKTKDPRKKRVQVSELLNLVDLVVNENGGKPYTDELFSELKKEEALKLRVQGTEVNSQSEISELRKQVMDSYDEQLKKVTEMVDSKLKEATQRLENLLAEEHAARIKLEADAEAARKKSDDEINELRKRLEGARMETEELRKQALAGKCSIL